MKDEKEINEILSTMIESIKKEVGSLKKDIEKINSSLDSNHEQMKRSQNKVHNELETLTEVKPHSSYKI